MEITLQRGCQETVRTPVRRSNACAGTHALELSAVARASPFPAASSYATHISLKRSSAFAGTPIELLLRSK
jgi:hypothetical protein